MTCGNTTTTTKCGSCTDTATTSVTDTTTDCNKSTTYIESRVINQVTRACPPKVIAPPGTAVTISGQSCNASSLASDGILTRVEISPSSDGAISFSGCGTVGSPFVPVLDYTKIAENVNPSDSNTYVTTSKCGFSWTQGKLTTLGQLISNIQSSDNSIVATYNSSTCTFDLKVKTASSATDGPAEVCVMTASTSVVGPVKTVSVTINGTKIGSTGTVSVQPNVGSIQSQSYTATTGTTTLSFTIDNTSTSAVVTGTNSARTLITANNTINLAV